MGRAFVVRGPQTDLANHAGLRGEIHDREDYGDDLRVRLSKRFNDFAFAQDTNDDV